MKHSDLKDLLDSLVVKYNRIDFIENFIDNDYSKQEAIESWDILINTYRDYLAKFSLPGALDNYTDRQILDQR